MRLNFEILLRATSLLTFLIIGSCSKNSDPAPVTILTIKLDPSSSLSTAANTVFISDEAGNILDTKTLPASQTVELKSNKVLPTNMVNVSIFSYSNGSFVIESYLNIPVGASWTYGARINTVTASRLGVAQLNINNFTNSSSDFSYSDENGDRVNSSSQIISTALRSYINIYSNMPKVHVSTMRNSNPVYADVNNPTVGATYDLDLLTDFKNFDHIINFDLSGTSSFSVNIGASNNATYGYGEGYLFSTAGTGVRPVGYNDGFTTYHTDVADAKTTNNPAYSLITKKYSKTGTIIHSQPALLNYELNVADNSYGNFTFSINGPYTYRISNWSENIGTSSNANWAVFAPPGAKQVLNLPSEIQSKYPTLDLKSLIYYRSIFVVNLDGTTYESQYLQNTVSKEIQSIEFFK